MLALAQRRRRVSYPPGPPEKLFLGNALDVPSKMPWIKYLKWSKQFGDIIHLSAMNMHIVVLHKMEDIIELMEKRSANYSSRPSIPISELLGSDGTTALIPYGDKWRKQRTILQEGFKKEAMPLYHRVHTEKVHLFTDLLLRRPDQFKEHCKWLSAAVTVGTTFGYNIAAGKMDDQYVTTAERITAALSPLLQPGGTLINVIPILGRVPTWVPGASTQRRAAEVKKLTLTYRDLGFEYAKRNLASIDVFCVLASTWLTDDLQLCGRLTDCVLTRVLQRRQSDEGSEFNDEDAIKDSMAAVYLAGTETTQASLLIFIMAMALYPSVQRRAQAEIDKIVGADRLPEYYDRPSLSYIEALMRESMRWRLALPLAIPHMTVKDDVYKGFSIPKGTLVLPNGWALGRDESVYANPEDFDPERFLLPDGTLNDDRIDFAFGYGRRICPGRHMARDVLWMAMASVLATFNISKATDKNGNEIDIDCDAFSSGLSRQVVDAFRQLTLN
ncbi:hypothetical protein APHAL10511_007625 [Amanita phalloides]|nr:hypothetical protein APHAL10511_007625 [Amanita phalloides]